MEISRARNDKMRLPRSWLRLHSSCVSLAGVRSTSLQQGTGARRCVGLRAAHRGRRTPCRSSSVAAAESTGEDCAERRGELHDG